MQKIENENLNINLTLPLKENLVIIPRLIIAGLLSNEKINIEEIENTKLIISEALNLLIDKTTQNKVNIDFFLEKNQEKLILKLIIRTILTNEILQNISKSGLTVQILSYLCSKFSITEKTFNTKQPETFQNILLNQKIIEIIIEKEL
ncbi:MAG: hypothetical protein ACK4GJ_04870 [bacterium]